MLQPAEAGAGLCSALTLKRIQIHIAGMGNFQSNHYHLVFTVDKRERLIAQEIEGRVWAYLHGIARNNRIMARAIGGVEDHIHMLCDIPASMAVSEAIRIVKGGSSYSFKREFESLQNFEWQDGYGSFTVSPSALDAVANYIRRQRYHHAKRNLMEEMRILEGMCPSKLES